MLTTVKVPENLRGADSIELKVGFVLAQTMKKECDFLDLKSDSTDTAEQEKLTDAH